MTEQQAELRKIIGMMNESYSDCTFCAEDVGSELAMRPREIRGLLQEELGITFRGLLNEIRIKAAKELTVAGSVTGWRECALAVGFTDPRYFSRIFTRQEGMTWGDFRDKIIEARTALTTRTIEINIRTMEIPMGVTFTDVVEEGDSSER